MKKKKAKLKEKLLLKMFLDRYKKQILFFFKIKKKLFIFFFIKLDKNSNKNEKPKPNSYGNINIMNSNML
jgi:hypothetical protein